MSLDVKGLLDRLVADYAAKGTVWDYHRVTTGFRARCPNPTHADTDPSWTIRDDPGSDRHGSHHCFSCRFGGGPWELAAVVWDCDLLEAGRRLGGSPRWTPPRADDVTTVSSLLVSRPVPVPVGVVVPGLGREWPRQYASYLLERGVPLQQAVDWGIGYAASGPLAGRVWAPVTDVRGRLLSWSARDAVGRTDAPRYLEATSRVCARCGSPVSAKSLDSGRACRCGSRTLVSTNKTAGLFGLHRAIPIEDAVTVCEGVWSCLALDRAGWPNCLALLGSDVLGGRGLSARLHEIGQWDGPIYVATDPDQAGDRVAADISVLDGYQGQRRRVVRVRLTCAPDDATLSELASARRKYC